MVGNRVEAVRRSPGLAVALVSVVAVSGCFLEGGAADQAVTASRDTAHPIKLSTGDVIPLGMLKPGEAAHAEVSVRNHSLVPLTVDRIETGCSCVRVTPTWVRLGAGDATSIVISFDPSDELEFRGRLSVDLIGYGGDKALIRAKVDLTVSPDA